LSFRLWILAIFGAVVYKYGVLYTAASEGEGLALVVGTATAFLSGLLAIAIVFRLLAKQELRKFAYYCWVAAVAFGVYLALTEGAA
jgi:undecaprenyl pyrophosphate phosphatase UppP